MVPTATATADQDEDTDRYHHKEVDGSQVVKDRVLLSGLSRPGRPVPLHGTRVLTLADGRIVHACRDCSFLGTRTAVRDGRTVLSLVGDIRKHRHEKHGVAMGGTPRGGRGPPRGDDQPEELPLDEIDQAGLPYPNEHIRGMQLGDLLELAEHIDQWGRVMGALTDDRDRWKERATAAERRIREIERALGKIMPTREGDGD